MFRKTWQGANSGTFITNVNADCNENFLYIFYRLINKINSQIVKIVTHNSVTKSFLNLRI